MPNNFLFDLLGPFYDHVISPKEPDTLHLPLNLPADGWLLDVGGGTGRASVGLAQVVEHLVVCDLSISMLREAQAKGIQNLVQASATHLPFAAETFERIMVIDALHHMPDQKDTLGEMIRTLKRNGRLLVEEPDIRLFVVKLIALFEKLALMKSLFHTPEQIKEMAESFGTQAQISSDGKGSAWVMADK
jgi:ubiquinone/menaquinone biosynthesis C-methylase UbiE